MALKQFKASPEICMQERIGLSLCHLSRELLSLFKLVTIVYIGIMLLAVLTLKILNSKHGSLKGL
jgi:hypothetical protein